MKKEVIFVFLLMVILFIVSLSFSVKAQSGTQTTYTLNSETTCNIEDICQTKIYSFEKYFFDSKGEWEEIDENWHTCEEGFCTNAYHFNAIAKTDGTVSAFLNDKNLTMQLSDFPGHDNLRFTPTIDGSILTYSNVVSNVDLKYQYLPRQLKEEIVIKKPLANPPLTDLNIAFTKSGDADFAIPDSIVCDSNDACKLIKNQITDNVITIPVPASFLNDPNTVYPVILDPTLTLNDTHIFWDGYIRNKSAVFRRANNPKGPVFVGNTNATLKYRAASQWNISTIPDNAHILDLNLSLYFTDISCEPGVCINIAMNLTHMEGNNNTYPDDATGNLHFFDDMGNGTTYGVGVVNPGSTGWQNITINEEGKQGFENALANDEFNFGFRIGQFGLTARFIGGSNTIQNSRPSMILTYTTAENLVYDGNGNLIEGFGKLMTYDDFNRLVQVNKSGNGRLIAEYAYDHEGNRVKKVEYNMDSSWNNETTYYIDESFIHIRNTNGTIINETYFYAAGKQLAKKDNDGNIFFYHPDHLGSTTLVTNESGDVVKEVFYLPFGDVLEGDITGERYGFTGQENDGETGFIDFGPRKYDPKFRHFIQPDTIIQDIYNPQDLNRYAYVRNNPYKYVDPTGDIAVTTTVVIASSAIIVGVAIISGVISGYEAAQNPQATWTDIRNAGIGGAAGGAAGATTAITGVLLAGIGGAVLGAVSPGVGEYTAQFTEAFIENPNLLKEFDPIGERYPGLVVGEQSSENKIKDESSANEKVSEFIGLENRPSDEELLDIYNRYIYRPILNYDDQPGPDGVIYCYGCESQDQDEEEGNEQV